MKVLVSSCKRSLTITFETPDELESLLVNLGPNAKVTFETPVALVKEFGDPSESLEGGSVVL